MKPTASPRSDSSATAGRNTSGAGFIGLLQALRASGGAAPAEVLTVLLQEARVGDAAELNRLIDTDQVLGFEWRDALWIPMFQFERVGLAPKAVAAQVLASLPAAWSDWERAHWFGTLNPTCQGRSPADALDLDGAAVVRAAQTCGRRAVAECSFVAAFTPMHVPGFQPVQAGGPRALQAMARHA